MGVKHTTQMRMLYCLLALLLQVIEGADVRRKALGKERSVREIPYDDYGGVYGRRDAHQRGLGRKPPRPVCLFSTRTRLEIVTMTMIVEHSY